MEERQISVIHKIILGIYSHNLKEALAVYKDEIDMTDADGRTPLIWASWKGDIAAVEQLIQAKADLNIQIDAGMTALMAASISGSTKCLELLSTADADPSRVNSQGWNALHYAAFYHNRDRNIKILIEKGCDMNVRDAYGTTPLAHAAGRGHVTVATALLDCGADIDSLDSEGDSALHESAHYHSDDVTELLLSRGAIYTLWDSNGDSVLHIAAKSGGNRTVEIMLAARLHGIDPDARNRGGKSALQLAQERRRTEGGFVEKFQELLEDIRARNATLQTPILENLDPQSRSWSPHVWLHSISVFFQTTRARNLQNNPHHPGMTFRFSFFWTYWGFSLFLLGCIWIYRNLDLGQVSSLLGLIWEMVDPGDLKGL